MSEGTDTVSAADRSIQLGLGPNLAQFSLLIIVNAFVGAMVGLERTILPAMAEQEFHLAARTAVLSFIVVFGVVKAVTNYFAGRLSDSVGRKAVLVGGLVDRAADSVSPYVGTLVELGPCGECASGRESRVNVVYDRNYEDRPRRTGAPRARHGSK